MADGGASAAVRVWEITGVDVDDRGLVNALRTEVTPRIQAAPGWLGGYLMVDRERSALISIGFWADAESLEASSELSTTMAQAVATLTSGQVAHQGRWELLVADAPAMGALVAEAVDA